MLHSLLPTLEKGPHCVPSGDKAPLTEPQESGTLIIEDDVSLREALSLTLSVLNLSAEWACTGAEAIEAIANSGLRPSLVVVDGRLPDMHGLEVVAQIKPYLSSQTQIFLFTAEAHLDPAMLASKGLHGLLRKPDDLEALLALIEKHGKVRLQ